MLCFVAIAHDFVYIMCSKTAFLHANLLSKYVTGSTWGIIPVSKLLITMAGRPPNNPPNGFFPLLVKSGAIRNHVSKSVRAGMIHPTDPNKNGISLPKLPIQNGNRSSFPQPSLDVWHASANYDLRLPVLGGIAVNWLVQGGEAPYDGL